MSKKAKKETKKITLPPFDPLRKNAPEIPVPSFDNNPVEIFKDPEDIIFDPQKKRVVLEKLEEAYMQAWISQKVLEITYQRFLHDFYDRGGLNKNALVAELTTAQNEIRIAEGMLHTIKEWYKHIEK